MLFKKRRRRRLAEELKENLIAQDQLPTTSASLISTKKTPFAKVQCVSSSEAEDPLWSCEFPFDCLPAHVQDKIFYYLPLRSRILFELVCTRWRSRLRASWRDVRSARIPSSVTELLSVKRPIDDRSVCGFLHKCGAYLERIYIYIPYFLIGQHVLYSICQICSNLKSLTLVTDLEGGALTCLLKLYSHQLSSLRSFTLKYQRSDPIHNGLRAVARSMTSLREFSLESSTLPSNVSALFPNSPHISKFSLIIRQPWRIDNSFVSEFFSYLADVYNGLEAVEVVLRLGASSFDDNALRGALANLADRHESLRDLRLSLAIAPAFAVEGGARGAGVQALSALSHFSALRCLHLASCELPSNFASVITEASLGSRLTELCLRNMQNISGPQLVDVFSALPALAVFSLMFSTEEGFPSPRSVDSHVFTSMFMLCFGLQSVELTECRYVDRLVLVPAFRSAFHNAGQSNWLGAEASLTLRAPPFATSPCICSQATLRLVRCGPDGGSLPRKRKAGTADAAVCCDSVDFASFSYSLTVERVCPRMPKQA